MKLLKKLHLTQGGLFSYLSTSDAREVEEKIKNGDKYAKLIYDSMIYQIAKDIGSLAVALKGSVDAIILTGGMAYSNYITNNIKTYVGFISNVEVYPGEKELESLAMGALRVIKGEEQARRYKEKELVAKNI